MFPDETCSLSVGTESHFQTHVVFIRMQQGKKKKSYSQFCLYKPRSPFGRNLPVPNQTAGALLRAERGTEGSKKGIKQEEEGYNYVHPLPDAMPSNIN